MKKKMYISRYNLSLIYRAKKEFDYFHMPKNNANEYIKHGKQNCYLAVSLLL